MKRFGRRGLGTIGVEVNSHHVESQYIPNRCRIVKTNSLNEALNNKNEKVKKERCRRKRNGGSLVVVDHGIEKRLRLALRSTTRTVQEKGEAG